MKKPIPFGKYLLLERVNVGGMAEVFKAKAFGVEGFERLVAVKRILPSIAEDQEFITMFIDEAKIAVQLTHANIAQIFDLGKVADSYFIAMEFVRGKDLRAIFDRVRKRGETVPVPMACYCVMKVCEGLDYAHNKKDAASRNLNLVHRDVSPQNVLISYDGEIKLIDFGIAKAANKAGKTQAGILKGKFGYMSPEQVRGLPLDRRSDIFAVGIVLYELLTGERLFVGESDFSTLEKVRNVEIMPPSTYNRKIPEELEQIVLKALAKDVDDRYQTAMDLHDDLQSFMYTSGNFFARKDLAAYMKKSFQEEITREEARDEQYRQIKAPGAESGAEAFNTLPSRKDRPPSPPSLGEAANVSKAPPPPPPRPKPTLLGMGGSAPPPPPPPPPAAPAGPALDMDWDDDELATAIYDKPAGPGMSPTPSSPGLSSAPPIAGGPSVPSPMLGAAAAAHPSLSPVSTQPRSHKPGNPSPFDDVAAPSDAPASPRAPELREPTELTRNEKDDKGSLGLVIGGGVALLLIIGGGLWFMLRPPAPGTIQLATEPPDPVVLFDEAPVPATSSPFVIANVPPGPHLIEVRKRGYRTWSSQVELAPGQDLRLPDVRLVPAGEAPVASGTAGFTVASSPSGAKVLVDGVERSERTPASIQGLTPGAHTIRLEMSGRPPWETTVNLTAGQVVAIPEVVLGAGQVAVRFLSEPRGAEVVLRRGEEERRLGRTPTRADVDNSEGLWTVHMERAGYEPWSQALRVPPGRETFTVEAELERARVAHSDRPRRTPMVRQPPSHMRSGPIRQEPPRMVETMAMAAVRGGTGTLRINSRPWSQVYVDGRLIGNTPQMNVQLEAGRHRVTLVNPDFNIRHTVSVNIQPGETTTRIVQLPTN